MRLIVIIKRFFVRYVNAAVNDNSYRNFLRHTRRRTLELKYDLDELEGLYRRKEKEKKIQLTNNLKELQTKVDKMQQEYDDAIKKHKERLFEEFTNIRFYYDNRSEEFTLRLEELDMKRVELEKEIKKLEKTLEDRKAEVAKLDEEIEEKSSFNEKHKRKFFNWKKHEKNNAKIEIKKEEAIENKKEEVNKTTKETKLKGNAKKEKEKGKNVKVK